MIRQSLPLQCEYSILHIDLLTGDKGEADQQIGIEIFFMHVYTGDLTVFVGFVVIDPF